MDAQNLDISRTTYRNDGAVTATHRGPADLGLTTTTPVDGAGALLGRVSPTGVTRAMTYDLDRRLASDGRPGLGRAYGYDASGRLERVTEPDGNFWTLATSRRAASRRP